jgi:hypothetical protein
VDLSVYERKGPCLHGLVLEASAARGVAVHVEFESKL